MAAILFLLFVVVVLCVVVVLASLPALSALSVHLMMGGVTYWTICHWPVGRPIRLQHSGDDVI